MIAAAPVGKDPPRGALRRPRDAGIWDNIRVAEPERTSDAEGRDEPEVVPIASDLATRVGAILEAVQREADRIIDAAREEAQRAVAARAAAASGDESPGGAEEAQAESALQAEALRVAMQMAAVGCTRAQVESHLRGYLRLADPTPVLDRVFGIGSAPGDRVSWALRPPRFG